MADHQPSIAPWAEAPAAPPQDSAFVRLWRGFATARVAIAVVLLALLAVLHSRAPQPPPGSAAWLFGLCGAYLACALAVRILTRPPTPGEAFDPQWVSTIGVDLLAFSTLQFLQAGGVNYSPLFALPVLMASVLGSTLLALGTAAAVTLLLLIDAWLLALQLPDDTAQRFLQAGLTGTGYFALAFLANQLAQRLAREEKAARRSQKAARAQAQVNELVIETLADGVLVVDQRGEVHAANPSARLLLGGGPAAHGRPFPLAAVPGWQPLVDLATLTFELRDPQLGEISLSVPAGPARRVFVRTRLTAQHDAPGDSLCVMFLEDLREMEARLRTEKLAAMGRMSAAVAHEIRNPLAAITQANALLEEDLVEPAHKQLSAMVAQNARRLARIVEDILNISRVRHDTHTPMLGLDAAVAAACADWGQQTCGSARMQLALQAGTAQVPFEPDHLRRVLVNLLDNALRHAGSQCDSIQVLTSEAASRVRLLVWSDGPPLEPTVERHLFEPFFSSESRSSGLGLYICRELCEQHGAQIGYRRCAARAGAAREGNEFFVQFRPGGSGLAATPSFATIGA
ncbi:ATP-binding protein [uncultured Ramlibacter sp.]|uniref:sensor histidine kinase n=1 Tax=uncultured Ramlibacter sp. TaxID=260755 RepID=UPI0026177470|nr:ATP-binding protein [uncultured Ramlibacter sp.]